MQLKSHLNIKKKEEVSAPAVTAISPNQNKSTSAFSSDYFLVFIFFFVGSSLWAGKEVQSIQARQGNAYAASVSVEREKPLPDFRDGLGIDLTSEEALKWIHLLISIEDAELSLAEQFKKYQSLSMATAIMSASSGGSLRQRFWSGQSVAYSEESLDILAHSDEMHPAAEIDQANVQLLMAMALNYFQEGGVQRDEVANQFENISADYLMSNGFFENKLLRALAKENIIELPGLHAGINI